MHDQETTMLISREHQEAIDRIATLEAENDELKAALEGEKRLTSLVKEKLTDCESALYQAERMACPDAESSITIGALRAKLQAAEAERDKWKRLAIHNGKRLEAVRALVSTKHESLSNFVSRVRECLYQDHFTKGKP
jgi:DNA gyrase/topoisomerase IV subunit A